MKIKLLCLVALSRICLPLGAAPLTESTFTEIVKDVKVIADASKTATPAQTQELLKAPDRVRTGPESRAELIAPDHTITRIGANTVFSFSDSGRTLNLEKGSLLFHTPKGMGGGTIKSGGAAAAVLGTTLIVSATTDGGFKVILLEGSGTVTLPNGKSVKLKAGQLVFVAPDDTVLSSVLDINLERLVAGSLLVNGFGHPLPSTPLIQDAMRKQHSLIARGKAVDTGKPAESGLGSVDHGAYQTAAHPTLSIAQYGTIANSGTGGFGAGGRNLATIGFKP